MADDLDPILIQVTVPLPIPMIFSGFVEPAHLSHWLCHSAKVEGRVGAPYELEFTDDPPFTSKGVVTHFTQDLDIGFTWQAPPPFTGLLTGSDGALSTHVYVRLQESPEGIDVTLEHAGWKSGDAWEEARSWHFHLWDERLHRFKDYLMQAAYG